VNEHSAMLNPAATDHLPFFITAPGQTDGLFNAMIVFLIVVVFSVGLVYLRLHALPEHLAHGASKVQLQLVGVLALLALFTHNHIFWIAALLLALVQFPNFSAPLASMAQSLEKLADRAPPAGTLAPSPDAEVTSQEAVSTKAVPTRKTPITETERAPAVPERVA
jgi:multisubunit Na+/H+ antiporter MnhF subunit